MTRPMHPLRAATITVLLTASGTSVLAASPSPTVGPPLDPSRFSAQVTNPWFPLTPGTTLTYRGRKDGERAVDTVEVTNDIVVIGGVPCVAVKDTLTQGGAVVERTTDWYSQDSDGNVWYYGEDTAELDADGNVLSTEGTWQAGLDGAAPGLFMPAEPTVGQSFQQEYLPGHAEDHYVVLQVGVPVTVPYGSFEDALLTAEWTPLEPDVLSEKAYVRGIGEVSERDVTGSDEHFELVSVRTD